MAGSDRQKFPRPADCQFRREVAALRFPRADSVSTDGGEFHLSGADGSGRFRAIESRPVPDRRRSKHLARPAMGDGDCPPPGSGGVAPMAIPVDGGPPRLLCPMYCIPKWSSDGKFLFVTVERPSRTGPGRTLAIPVGLGESLPDFPPGGIKPRADASVVAGAQSVPRADFVPGRDPSHFAFVSTSVHRNLYRISLP